MSNGVLMQNRVSPVVVLGVLAAGVGTLVALAWLGSVREVAAGLPVYDYPLYWRVSHCAQAALG